MSSVNKKYFIFVQNIQKTLDKFVQVVYNNSVSDRCLAYKLLQHFLFPLAFGLLTSALAIFKPVKASKINQRAFHLERISGVPFGVLLRAQPLIRTW